MQKGSMLHEYKYEELKNTLLQKILNGEYPPGSKLLGDQELSKEYGVSTVTVRKALSELTDDGFIVRIKKAGTFVKDTVSPRDPVRKTFSVVIAARERYDISLMKIIRGIQQQASRSGAEILVDWCDASVPRSEHQIIGDRIREGIQGFILYLWNPADSLQDLDELDHRRIPYVLIDRGDYTANYNIVSCDNYTGGILATKALLDAGHRNNYFIGYDFFLSSEQQRYQGFRTAMLDAGLSLDQNRLILDYSGEALIKMIRSQDDTAFFCCNDRLALKIITSLRAYGLNPYDDYSIVGFDDWESDVNNSLGLTTIRQDFSGLGKNAFLILDLLCQGAVSEPRIKLYSNVSLISRHSIKELPIIT